MTVKSAQAIAGSFATVGATGALTAATGTPVGTLYVAGVANGAAVAVTGANPYKWAVTLPALAAGDVVQMYVTATIAGVATGGFVWDDVADTSLASDVAATLGVAGAGLTALGDTRLANLDAAVSSRSTLTAADVWAHGTRTLTQSAASVAAVVAGSEITVYRGDTWSISLTGLGAITGYTDVWFTVKNSPTETDAEALVQVSQTVGLERLNGAAGTAAQGSLVVDDASAGNITITVAAAASAQIATAENLVYDVQWKTATGLIHTLTANVINVSGDVTRATA